MFNAPCSWLCGKPIKRLHFTCSFCRIRRWATGEIKPPEYSRADFSIKYHYHKDGRSILPTNAMAYVIIINKDRKHKRIKQEILKRLLTIAEALAN